MNYELINREYGKFIICLITFSSTLGMQHPHAKNKQEKDFFIQQKQYYDRLQALRHAIYLDSVEDYAKLLAKINGQKIRRADMVTLFGEAIWQNAHKIVHHAARNPKLKNKYLYEAVDRGSFDTIKLLLKNGANINYKPDKCLSCIEMIVHKGNLAIADYLLEQGTVLPKFATVHAWQGDSYQMDRIHYLIRFHNPRPARIRWLLDHGHDPDERDDGKPLLYATQNPGHIECLCDAGANPNGPCNSFGSRLVFLGFPGTSYEVFKTETLNITILLLAAGADINATESLHRHTALHIAAQHNIQELVAFLLYKGARKDITDKQGRTAFDLAKDPAIKEMLWADNRPALPEAALSMLERIQKKKTKLP